MLDPSSAPRVARLALLLSALVLSVPRTTSADFKFKNGTFAKSDLAAPTNQSVTGVGFRPKAVIFYWTRQTATGVAAGIMTGYGFATGANEERAVAIASDDNHNVAFAWGNTAKRQSQSRSIIILTNGGGTLGAEAELSSLDSDGFTLGWTTNEPRLDLIHYVALGGTDVTAARADSFTTTGVAGPQSVATLGFRPDFLMVMAVHMNGVDFSTTEAQAAIGLASSPTNQVTVGVQLEDAEAARDTCVQQRLFPACPRTRARAGIS